MSVLSCDSIAGAPAHPQPELLLGAWAGSAALVYCRDWNGNMLAANHAFARKFGCNAAEMCGRPLVSLMHQDDASTLTTADAELHSAAQRVARESRWLTPQGWRWISW